MIAASSPPSVVDGCNRRPSTPRSSARSVCVAGKVRASVASWVARASLARRWQQRPPDRRALLDEAPPCQRRSHDQQDRQADCERPQPVGRSTRVRNSSSCAGGGIEELALERICLTGMGCGPVERGSARAVQLGGIAPGGVPVDRRAATRWWSRRPSRSSSNQLRRRPLSQQRLVRDLGRAVARGDETPCDERREHVRLRARRGAPRRTSSEPSAGSASRAGVAGTVARPMSTAGTCSRRVAHRAAHTTGVVVAGVGEGAAAAAHPVSRVRSTTTSAPGWSATSAAIAPANPVSSVNRRGGRVPRSRAWTSASVRVRRAGDSRRARARTPGTRRSGRSSPPGTPPRRWSTRRAWWRPGPCASRNAVCGLVKTGGEQLLEAGPPPR